MYQPISTPVTRPMTIAMPYPIPSSAPLVPMSSQMSPVWKSFTNACATSFGPGRKRIGMTRAFATSCQAVRARMTLNVPMTIGSYCLPRLGFTIDRRSWAGGLSSVVVGAAGSQLWMLMRLAFPP